MAERMRRAHTYRGMEADRYRAYRERQYASRGMAALVMGLISLALLLCLVLWCVYRGGIGKVEGAFGIGAFYLACLGLWEGLKSFGDRCKSYALSKAGTVLCGLIAALWFLTICWGIA